MYLGRQRAQRSLARHAPRRLSSETTTTGAAVAAFYVDLSLIKKFHLDSPYD